MPWRSYRRGNLSVAGRINMTGDEKHTYDWKDEYIIIKEKSEERRNIWKVYWFSRAGGFRQMKWRKQHDPAGGIPGRIVFLGLVTVMQRLEGRSRKVLRLSHGQKVYGEYKATLAAFEIIIRVFWTDKLEAGYEEYNRASVCNCEESPSAVLGSGCFYYTARGDDEYAHPACGSGSACQQQAVVDHDSVVYARSACGSWKCGKKQTVRSSRRKEGEAGEVIFSTRRKDRGRGVCMRAALEDALYAFGFGPQCSCLAKICVREGTSMRRTRYICRWRRHREIIIHYCRININMFKRAWWVMENIFGWQSFYRMWSVGRAESDRET